MRPVYIETLVLMLAGGGRSLEDMRTFKADTALATLPGLGVLPSTDVPSATGCAARVRVQGLSV